MKEKRTLIACQLHDNELVRWDGGSAALSGVVALSSSSTWAVSMATEKSSIRVEKLTQIEKCKQELYVW